MAPESPDDSGEAEGEEAGGEDAHHGDEEGREFRDDFPGEEVWGGEEVEACDEECDGTGGHHRAAP